MVWGGEVHTDPPHSVVAGHRVKGATGVKDDIYIHFSSKNNCRANVTLSIPFKNGKCKF